MTCIITINIWKLLNYFLDVSSCCQNSQEQLENLTSEIDVLEKENMKIQGIFKFNNNNMFLWMLIFNLL